MALAIIDRKMVEAAGAAALAMDQEKEVAKKG